VGVSVTISGKGPGSDRLLASVGGRRFPAPVSIRNEGETAVEVTLRIKPPSGARVRIETERFIVPPGARVETRLEAESPSLAEDDTVLEVLLDGVVEQQFRFTVVSLARESIFHGLGRP
jgi:hypothetical protein